MGSERSSLVITTDTKKDSRRETQREWNRSGLQMTKGGKLMHLFFFSARPSVHGLIHNTAKECIVCVNGHKED